MRNPEKKDSTISAVAEGAILGFSASILLARRRCNSVELSTPIPGLPLSRYSSSTQPGQGVQHPLAEISSSSAGKKMGLTGAAFLWKEVNFLP
jgi:hypothetical protein